MISECSLFLYQYPSGFPYCPYHEDFQIGTTKCWTPVDCLHCQDQLQGAQYSIFNIQYSINQCQCNCQHQDLVLFSPWWSWASFLPLPLSFYHFINVIIATTIITIITRILDSCSHWCSWACWSLAVLPSTLRMVKKTLGSTQFHRSST